MKKQAFFTTFFTAVGIFFGGSHIVHAQNTDQNQHGSRPDFSGIQRGHKYSSDIFKEKNRESKNVSPVSTDTSINHKHHNDKNTMMHADNNTKKKFC